MPEKVIALIQEKSLPLISIFSGLIVDILFPTWYYFFKNNIVMYECNYPFLKRYNLIRNLTLGAFAEI
jgi:hypothetical protein